MISVLAVVLLFALLVTIHEWGHFIVAKRQGIHVEVFSVGFGPYLLKYRFKETLYVLSLIPLGGYVKMAGSDPSIPRDQLKETDFFAKTPLQRIKVALAGPIMNYILAYFLFIIVFAVGCKVRGTLVDTVQTKSLAEKAHFLSGDRILSVNNKTVHSFNEIRSEIENNRDQNISVMVLRNNKKMFRIIPLKESKSLPLGIIPSKKEMYTVKYSLRDSFYESLKIITNQTTITAVSIYNLILGKASLKKSLTGPIGIVFITSQEAKKGWVYFLRIMATLSIALGFFNLLPIPILDGGHIFFYTIESLFKKPLPLKIQLIVQNASIFFFLSLTVFVFYNDILKFKLDSKVKYLWTKVLFKKEKDSR